MAWIGIGALIVTAAALAMLLRACRAPGWSVIGGVCAGLLLGPTLLGQAAPDLYHAMYLGGAAQRQQLLALEEYQRHAMMDPDRVAVAPEAIAEARRDLLAAQRDFQAPLRTIALCITAFVLFGAAAGQRGDPDPRQGFIHALSIGGWAALLPGGIAFIVLNHLMGLDAGPALIASSAVAVGPWMLSQADRRAAELAEHGGAHLLFRAGVVASAIAVAALMYGMWRAAGASGLIYILPLAGLAASWLIPPLRAAWLARPLASIAVPALAGFAAIRVDLHHDLSLWPIILLLALSGDGRWLGAYLGAMLLGGRKSLRTMRLVMGSMACGPTQLAVTVIAASSGALPGKYILPLLFGAALVEALAPLRRRMAERLIQTEIEIDEIMNDS